MSDAYLQFQTFPSNEDQKQHRVLQEVVRDPSYLQHFALEPPHSKKWDSRHHLGKLPGYDAMNDRYCKWVRKKKQAASVDKITPSMEMLLAQPAATFGGIAAHHPNAAAPMHRSWPAKPNNLDGGQLPPIQHGWGVPGQSAADPQPPIHPRGVDVAPVHQLSALAGDEGIQKFMTATDLRRPKVSRSSPGVPAPGQGPVPALPQLFAKSKQTISDLWDRLGIPEVDRQQFASVAFAEVTTENLKMMNDEIQHLLDRRNASVHVEKNIEIREGFLYLLQELSDRVAIGTFDREKTLKEAMPLITSFRTASLDVVESVVKWREVVSNHQAVYFWKGTSYLMKMQEDLAFIAHSKIATVLDFNVKHNPFLYAYPLRIRDRTTEDTSPQAHRDESGLHPAQGGLVLPHTSAQRLKYEQLLGSKQAVDGYQLSGPKGQLPPVKQKRGDWTNADVFQSRVVAGERVLQDEGRLLAISGKKSSLYRHASSPSTLEDDEVPEEIERADVEEEQEPETVQEEEWLTGNLAKHRALEHRAATKIQSAWRAFCDRQLVGAKALQKKSAVKLQKLARTYLAKKEMNKRLWRHNAARRIQSVTRGMLARSFVSQIHLEQAAATKIQSAWRGYGGRQIARFGLDRKRGATDIQRVWRGYSVRSKLAALDRAKNTRVATEIQRIWRGYAVRARPEFNPDKIKATTRIQVWWKGLLTREYYDWMLQRRNAAVRIQAWWRGILARDYVDSVRDIKQDDEYRVFLKHADRSALKIQKVWRGHCSRKVTSGKFAGRKQENATVSIQKLYRGFAARRELGHVQQLQQQLWAATKIQAVVRKAIAKSRFREAKATVDAATEIQRTVRGHKARQGLAEGGHQFSIPKYEWNVPQMVASGLVTGEAIGVSRPEVLIAATQEAAAMMMQRFCRCAQTRQKVKLARASRREVGDQAATEERQEAAVWIQCMMRRYFACQKVAKLQEERSLKKERDAVIALEERVCLLEQLLCTPLPGVSDFSTMDMSAEEPSHTSAPRTTLELSEATSLYALEPVTETSAATQQALCSSLSLLVDVADRSCDSQLPGLVLMHSAVQADRLPHLFDLMCAGQGGNELDGLSVLSQTAGIDVQVTSGLTPALGYLHLLLKAAPHCPAQVWDGLQALGHTADIALHALSTPTPAFGFLQLLSEAVPHCPAQAWVGLQALELAGPGYVQKYLPHLDLLLESVLLCTAQPWDGLNALASAGSSNPASLVPRPPLQHVGFLLQAVPHCPPQAWRGMQKLVDAGSLSVTLPVEASCVPQGHEPCISAADSVLELLFSAAAALATEVPALVVLQHAQQQSEGQGSGTTPVAAPQQDASGYMALGKLFALAVSMGLGGLQMLKAVGAVAVPSARDLQLRIPTPVEPRQETYRLPGLLALGQGSRGLAMLQRSPKARVKVSKGPKGEHSLLQSFLTTADPSLKALKSVRSAMRYLRDHPNRPEAGPVASPLSLMLASGAQGPGLALLQQAHMTHMSVEAFPQREGPSGDYPMLSLLVGSVGRDRPEAYPGIRSLRDTFAGPAPGPVGCGEPSVAGASSAPFPYLSSLIGPSAHTYPGLSAVLKSAGGSDAPLPKQVQDLSRSGLAVLRMAAPASLRGLGLLALPTDLPRAAAEVATRPHPPYQNLSWLMYTADLHPLALPGLSVLRQLLPIHPPPSVPESGLTCLMHAAEGVQRSLPALDLLTAAAARSSPLPTVTNVDLLISSAGPAAVLKGLQAIRHAMSGPVVAATSPVQMAQHVAAPRPMQLLEVMLAGPWACLQGLRILERASAHCARYEVKAQAPAAQAGRWGGFREGTTHTATHPHLEHVVQIAQALSLNDCWGLTALQKSCAEQIIDPLAVEDGAPAYKALYFLFETTSDRTLRGLQTLQGLLTNPSLPTETHLAVQKAAVGPVPDPSSPASPASDRLSTLPAVIALAPKDVPLPGLGLLAKCVGLTPFVMLTAVWDMLPTGATFPGFKLLQSAAVRSADLSTSPFPHSRAGAAADSVLLNELFATVDITGPAFAPLNALRQALGPSPGKAARSSPPSLAMAPGGKAYAGAVPMQAPVPLDSLAQSELRTLQENIEAKRQIEEERQMVEREAAAQYEQQQKRRRQDLAKQADERRHRAATTIQADWRGCQGRSRAREAKGQKEVARAEAQHKAEQEAQAHAVAVIENGWVQKGRPNIEHKKYRAARTIQSCRRCYLARQQVRSQRHNRDAKRRLMQEEEEAQEEAAVRIQCASRQKAARTARESQAAARHLKALAPSVETIQRARRSYMARREAGELRAHQAALVNAEKLKDLQQESALTLQLAYKCHKAQIELAHREFLARQQRKEANKLLSVRRIQCTWRQHAARSELQRRRSAKRQKVEEQKSKEVEEEEREMRELEERVRQEKAEAYERMRHTAAAVVQRAYKCYNARFMLEWKRKDREEARRCPAEKELLDFHNAAASKIQGQVRTQAERKRVQALQAERRAHELAVIKQGTAEAAATQIQCAYRAYCARFEMAWRRRRQGGAGEGEPLNKAAFQREMEALRTEMLTRRKAELEQEAAVKIQLSWRVYNAKFEAGWRRQRKRGDGPKGSARAPSAEPESTTAVSDVTAQEEASDQALRDKAAGLIQRVYRGMVGRSQARALWQQSTQQEEEDDAIEQALAAAQIQRVFRGMAARAALASVQRPSDTEVLLRNEAALEVQRVFRGSRGRREAERRRDQRSSNEAALEIQRVFRGSQARLEAADLRREQHSADAAVAIQRVYRGSQGRREAEGVRSQGTEEVAERREEGAGGLLEAASGPREEAPTADTEPLPVQNVLGAERREEP